MAKDTTGKKAGKKPGKKKKKAEKRALQVAALPIRTTKTGKVKVLMVTTRDGGRWVIPKGWQMKGETPWAAAHIEAQEEAGALGQICPQSLGSFHYRKRLRGGRKLRARVRVYPLLVEELMANWKESGQRKRKWFSVKAAAKRVREEELAALLAQLGRDAETARAR